MRKAYREERLVTLSDSDSPPGQAQPGPGQRQGRALFMH